MLTRSGMVTIKKRGQKLSSFLLTPFLCLLLTACGPAGPRNVIKGAKLLRNGDYQGAIEKLEAATHQLANDPAPVQAQAWNFLGLAYQSAGQPVPAFKAYQQALKLDRNLVEADYNIGVLELEQANYPAAVDYLTTYNTLRPSDLEGVLKLGSANLHWATRANNADKARRLEFARKCFDTAQRMSPTAEAANALGVVMLQRNRPTDAEKEFNAALKLDMNYAPAVLNLAIVAHEYQHDHRLALEMYRQYLALKPTPDNAAEIQTVVKSLEREFAPPPAVAVTPAPKPVVAARVEPTAPTVAPKPTPAPTTSAPVNPPSASAPVAKANPPAVLSSPRQQPEPTPKSVAAAPVSQPRSAPALKPATTSVSTPAPSATQVEVAQVSDNATPKAAQDIAVPTPAIPQPAMAPVTAPRAVTLQPLEPQPEKKSLLKKLNPVAWFGKKSKTKETPEPEVIKETPETKPVAETETVAATQTPSAVTPTTSKPAIARYSYLSPAKPAPGNAQAAAQFVAQGTNARRQSRPNDAIVAYRNALISDPANFDAAYLSGLTEQELSDYPTSLSHFELALAINPQSAQARYAFAWSLNKAKYPQDAANELEKLLQQTPDNTKANLLLATIYAQSLDEPKLARDHYLKVLALDPHHPQATAIRFWLAANP